MKSSLLLILLACLLFQDVTKQSHPDYVLDRTPAQGKLWLGWAPAERERFVLGYLWAYHLGFTSACRDYFESSPPPTLSSTENSPLQKCMLQELHYSEDVKHYVRRITSFYERFPGDTDLPLSWILQALSDSEGKTPDEIHAAWSRGHEHP
jgi:hypothetical protein